MNDSLIVQLYLYLNTAVYAAKNSKTNEKYLTLINHQFTQKFEYTLFSHSVNTFNHIYSSFSKQNASTF